jgi:hypothetical protein
MPAYEMTSAEQAQYGNTLNIWQAIRLLQTWHPLITFGQQFVGTNDPYAKSLVVSEAAEWIAAKTDATADDQVVRALANVLKTKEGEALVRLLLTFVGVQ